MATKEGFEGLSKSNISSLDNPLAYPQYGMSQTAGPYTYDYNSTSAPVTSQITPRQQPQPNPGGIIKSNFSSNDNPLAFGSYYQNNNSNPSYSNNELNANNNNNNYDPSKWLNTAQTKSSPINQPNNYSEINNNYDPSKWLNSNENSNQNNYSQQEKYQYFHGQDGYQPISKAENINNNQIRFDVDISNKQAYKRALDQQVAEKEIIKFKFEKANKQSEIDTLKQYPFGRRTDPTTYVFDENKASYKPSFGSANEANNHKYTYIGSTGDIPRLNKDNIIEKPNSLSADIPPYDPIKHRTGFHQGYNYDPWGKPGGGAPLIDPNTGRKFTKYSGQIWYDTLGYSPDDRAKMYADKNRPLTLFEQKNEMELERERKKIDDLNYKSRAGDVATWITEIEKQRNNRAFGAHLPHTNVTREKINKEYARRIVDEKTKSYHEDLGLQLEERYRNDKLHKLKDDVAGIEHTRKWDDWWGKPGGGAPNMDRRRKDLKDALEPPPDYWQRNKSSDTLMNSLPVGYSPRYYESNEKDELLFAKSTTKSNHRNLYDNMQPMKL